MKIKLILSFLTIVLLSCFQNLRGQQGRMVILSGEGEIHAGKITGYPAIRPVIEVEQNLREASNLAKQSLQNEDFDSKSHPLFQLPLRMKNGEDVSDHYTITGYVDHDSLYPNAILDYNCGDLTYDLDVGYNHSGTDFFIWPYPWKGMYIDEVEVIAAAPGTLLIKQDGNYDQNCDGTNQPYNGVCILHDDGTVAWYIHLKKNSLTSKAVGEQIAAGEYLGVVGSSGSSFAPHLHFEVYDANENLIDPFLGPCNGSVAESWWQTQLPYKKPAISSLSVHNKLPGFPECPQEEIPNEQYKFYPGDTVYFVTFFRNVFPDDTVEYALRRPDNTVFAEWLWFSPWEFYAASWAYNYTVMVNQNFGQWNLTAKYKGKYYGSSFELLKPQGVDDYIETVHVDLHPNPVESMLNIETGFKGKITCEIYNQFGSSLQSDEYQISEFVLNVKELPPGIYYLRIGSGERCVVKKIVKL